MSSIHKILKWEKEIPWRKRGNSEREHWVKNQKKAKSVITGTEGKENLLEKERESIREWMVAKSLQENCKALVLLQIWPIVILGKSIEYKGPAH